MEQEEQLQAVVSRINQLQAASVPSALHGLLRQAESLLKPPSRSTRGGSCAAAAGSAASRRSLVVGILALLEHAASLAAQSRDVKLLKDAQAQLVSAFQQHSWLWELLLRKHLTDLLQHPAAAQAFAEALSRLPSAAQARAYALWRQQLLRCHQAGSPPHVPLCVQQALLDQLLPCFHASKVSLPPLVGGDGGGVADADAGEQPARVSVMLRQQLPALLHLLLAATCSEGAAGGSPPAEALPRRGEARLEGERQSGNAGAAPCISSKQSAASCQRLPPQQRLEAAAQPEEQEESTSAARGPQADPPGGGGAACGVRDAVLRHAVLLVSQLSDPEALHAMLALPGQGAPGHGGGDGSGSEAEAGGAAAGRLSRRDAGRVQAARALIEVCLDGMLALPPLSLAIHRQLHSKGSSTGCVPAPGATSAASAGAAGEQRCGEGAEGPCCEQAAAAVALADAEDELRHTAGLLLGMHRELSRLLAEEQAGGSSSGGAQHAQRLSLPACRRLLHMMAAVPEPAPPAAVPRPVPSASSLPAGAGAGGGGDQPPGRQSPAQTGRASLAAGAAPAPPTLLLMPPQLAAQGLELVRQAVAAGAAEAGGGEPGWHADVAGAVAAIYLACYRAMWGARVLQSAEAYQHLLCSARLRLLLRAGGAAGAGEEGADAEAAAEAALLTGSTLGGRRRRARSVDQGLAGLSARTAGGGGGGAAAGQPAKRAKHGGGSGCSGGGSVHEVEQLLQLFQPPAAPVEAGQQQQAARKRIMPIPVARQEEQPAAAGAAPVAQRILPSPAAAAAAGSLQLASSEAAETQAQALASSGGDASGGGEAEAAAGPGGRQERDHQRFVLSKASALTEEEQEEVWAAYIADKEFLAEMLGDAGYQAWYDEAAHPLRRQQARAGGLEAAWAAVLGGPSAGSLVQQQLPRSLLQATGTMPWDAAAAACLQLLHLLLRGAGAAAGGTPTEQLGARRELLRRAFDARLRRDGAKAATNALLGFSGRAQVMTAMRAAAAAPAGGAMVALAAQLLGLVRGERSLAELPLFGGAVTDGRQERQALGRQWVAGGARLTAPPLLDAYCRLLAGLLPDAQAELAEDPFYGSGKPLFKSQQQVLPLALAAAMATRLLLLPPPMQHMLGPDCHRLLRLAVLGGGDAHAAAQLAAVLWMLARGGGAAAPAGVVRLPPRRPDWLEAESFLLQGVRGDPGCGNILLLGPARQVAAAAAAELLRQLRRHAGTLAAAGGDGAAEGLVPVADACHAAIRLLLAERQRHGGRGSRVGGESGSDDDSGGDVLAPPPLLLGQPASVEELGGLAAELCHAGAAAGGSVAAALGAALGGEGGAGGASAEGQAAAAASLLAVSNQFLEAADRLLGSGCLAAGAAQRLEGACQWLEGALRQVQQLCLLLPRSHPLLAAVGTAMQAAPALWQPDEEEESGSSDAGSDGGGDPRQQQRQRKPAGGSPAGKGGRRRRRGRRRLADVRNRALRAMLAEEGGGAGLEADDLSDLEDFIVCNPGRDYDAFFCQHFWQARGSDSEEEGEAQLGDGAGPAAPPRQQAARGASGATGGGSQHGRGGER